MSRARPAVAANSILVMRGRQRDDLGYTKSSSSGSATGSSVSSKVLTQGPSTTICITYRERELRSPRILRPLDRPVDQDSILSDTAPATVNKTNPTDENIQVQVPGGNNQASVKNALEHLVRSPIGRRRKKGTSPPHDR